MVVPHPMNLASFDLLIHGMFEHGILALLWSSNREELEQCSVNEGMIVLDGMKLPQHPISALILDFRKSYYFVHLFSRMIISLDFDSNVNIVHPLYHSTQFPISTASSFEELRVVSDGSDLFVAIQVGVTL